MRLKLPKYVQAFVDRHGVSRFYFRRQGAPRTPLPGLPYSPDFMTAHAAALAASGPIVSKLKRRAKAAPKPARPAAGSLSALIAEFKSTSQFASLAPSTSRAYTLLVDRLDAAHGGLPVAGMTRAHVEKLIDQRAAAGGPEAGNGQRKTLKALMKLAVRRGYRTDDPTAGVSKVARPKGAKHGNRPWTEADIAKFIARYPFGTREYLALQLLVCTAQRRSDVVKLGPHSIVGASYDSADFEGRQLSFVQKKTGRALVLPILPDLVAALIDAKIEKAAPAFMRQKNGRAYTAESFSNWFSERAAEAGIEGQASPHGLRHAAARRLAERGSSVHEIASWTGHTSLAEVSRYSKSADQAALAVAAISRK